MGNWQSDKRHGENGSLTWANGDKFTGKFEEGEMKAGTFVRKED